MLTKDWASDLAALNRQVILAQLPTLIAFWRVDGRKTRGPSPPPGRCTENDTMVAAAKAPGAGPEGEMLERELVA
jgi:hypothetical protein